MPKNWLPFISEHAGLLCVGFLLLNTAIWWLLARRDWRDDPSRKEGERKLLSGSAIVLSLPFLIMEAGTALQEGVTFWHFFRPQDGNPFVLLFFLYLFAFAIGLAVWVWFFGGAAFIARNARVFRWIRLTGRPVPWQPDEWHVKAIALALPFFYAAVTAGMVMTDLPADDITRPFTSGAPPE